MTIRARGGLSGREVWALEAGLLTSAALKLDKPRLY